MLPAIILFAKAPVSGKVKTRLARWLGPARAAELHEAFVRDMLEILAAAPADLRLASDSPDAWTGIGVPTTLQRGRGLGQRMLNAMRDALQEGRPAAMIVGSDSPTLPLHNVLSLLESPADVALGPCEDGGFYAICCRTVRDSMFDGVAWSTGRTLSMTVRAVQRSGLTAALGPPWFDVDRPEDLARLREPAGLPGNTRGWIDSYRDLLEPWSGAAVRAAGKPPRDAR